MGLTRKELIRLPYYCYCGAVVLDAELDLHINDHRDLPIRADLLVPLRGPVMDGMALDVS
jgi:hypothetical protein